MSPYVCDCTNVVYMFCVYCIYYYVNKFEARSLFSTSHLKKKCKDSKSFNNYRPISLLPSISKIFEYVIFYQTLDYFINNSSVCSDHFGFRPGRSTELTALKLVDHLISQLLYIDLSKAFNTLDHQILLSKLEYYGVTGTANTLFSNYLCNREQYVEYNGVKSNTLNISTGVPQGSILGLLLFFIYINNLPSVSNILNMLMYADDTTLYCNFNKDINEMIINRELYEVST